MDKRKRLDICLVERGLAEDKESAQRWIMAGQVRVNGQMVVSSDALVANDAGIELLEGQRYISRGGEKLEAALQTFSIDMDSLVCADVGASTGGFTDCLLQHGASRVYAIDVGQGILDWKLRQDPRVVVMENTNARNIASLPDKPDLVTIDASFISLKILLPVVTGWFGVTGSGVDSGMTAAGQIVALIKPQFEAGRAQAARGRGVVRDSLVHRQVLLDVLSYAVQLGCQVKGLAASPLLGPKGNREFLAWLVFPGTQLEDLNQMIELALAGGGRSVSTNGNMPKPDKGAEN